MQVKHVNVTAKFSTFSIVSLAFSICFMYFKISQDPQRPWRYEPEHQYKMSLLKHRALFERQIRSKIGRILLGYFSTKNCPVNDFTSLLYPSKR